MSDDGAVGSVREAFQGKRGKILMIGGGLAVAAYVIYTRRTGTPEVLTPEDLAPAATPGRNPQTDPTTGNDTQGGTKPTRPTSNAAWLSDGVDYLAGRGTPSANAYDALRKALDGLQLTAQQIAWVSQVISALGSPPEGMPPLNAGAPPGNPQSPPPTTPRPIPSRPPPTATSTRRPPPRPAPRATYDAVPVAAFQKKNPPWNSTLSGIAKKYGYASYWTIWNDAKNKPLRDKRKSPSKIQPRDVVYVKRKK